MIAITISITSAPLESSSESSIDAPRVRVKAWCNSSKSAQPIAAMNEYAAHLNLQRTGSPLLNALNSSAPSTAYSTKCADFRTT